MQRTYLEEDIRLIQKYFPGATTVALHTPFDLRDVHSRQPELQNDSFRATPASRWYGDLLWS